MCLAPPPHRCPDTGDPQDQDRQRVPRRGLDDVLLPASLKEKLEKVRQAGNFIPLYIGSAAA